MSKMIIMVGGTGGHVIPGIVVAKQLQKSNVQVLWLGTRVGLEEQLVVKQQLPIRFITISGLRGKSFFSWIFAPFKLMNAVLQALLIIKNFKPDCVLGMGGFVSGPGAVAAKLLRIPLLVHEQNSIPGLTNKLLAKIANNVFQAFPESISNAVYTGNPVSEELVSLALPLDRFFNRTGLLRLLVLGGSRGAVAVNAVIPQTLQQQQLKNYFEVLHQSGKNNFAMTYQRLNNRLFMIQI